MFTWKYLQIPTNWPEQMLFAKPDFFTTQRLRNFVSMEISNLLSTRSILANRKNVKNWETWKKCISFKQMQVKCYNFFWNILLSSLNISLWFLENKVVRKNRSIQQNSPDNQVPQPVQSWWPIVIYLNSGQWMTAIYCHRLVYRTIYSGERRAWNGPPRIRKQIPAVKLKRSIKRTVCHSCRRAKYAGKVWQKSVKWPKISQPPTVPPRHRRRHRHPPRSPSRRTSYRWCRATVSKRLTSRRVFTASMPPLKYRSACWKIYAL